MWYRYGTGNVQYHLARDSVECMKRAWFLWRGAMTSALRRKQQEFKMFHTGATATPSHMLYVFTLRFARKRHNLQFRFPGKSWELPNFFDEKHDLGYDINAVDSVEFGFRHLKLEYCGLQY